MEEPLQACIINQDVNLTTELRQKIGHCLGWQEDPRFPLCLGAYQPLTVLSLPDPNQVRIQADKVSFYQTQRTTLSGNVEIQQEDRRVTAQQAYVYRDPKTNQVTQIELFGGLRYLEPGRLLIARKAVIHPQDHSGTIEDVLYRFDTNKGQATLPAWGRASWIRRFANKNYSLKQATYTTCAPQDKAWDIKADSIFIEEEKAKGVAKNAVLRFHERPVFYTPYLSFPTNKERKSGFLMPLLGYSNVSGFDFGLPYYWNMAPNHDLTFTPHIYTKRGLMTGAEYRYLTEHGLGAISGNFLPKDKAFAQFLQNNEAQFPWLGGISTNRWHYGVVNTTHFSPYAQFNVQMQQVSDDYYLQDFSTNLSSVTERQLLQQVDFTYSMNHWVFRTMGQSYQTLHPVNETPIVSVYQRLPQMMARGYYYDLPLNANLNILGQYDQFRWPGTALEDPPNFWRPQGPRFHLNPMLSLPLRKSWGYLNPTVQLVENYYKVSEQNTVNSWKNPNFVFSPEKELLAPPMDFQRLIPRLSLDSGLYFDRHFQIKTSSITQTLEPRLFYLKVPYQNQTPIPVYDSGFMIFNVDQLFRTNRFSGFDRIGDADQLAYALTSRWLSDRTGQEFANFTLGQIRYFSDRKVQLCQSISGFCIDNPLTFGNLSPVSKTSPIASRAVYRINPVLEVFGDYVWDPATQATNNGDFNWHYQPQPRAIINVGYSYLINGDITQVRDNRQEDALHQATLAFAWPVSEKWSSVGIYSHNISKNYSMMSLFGLQYDSCCWAMRLVGGRTFKNLNAEFEPRYNSNVYLQLLLKGLGSVATSDPEGILSTYIPGYNSSFSH